MDKGHPSGAGSSEHCGEDKPVEGAEVLDVPSAVLAPSCSSWVVGSRVLHSPAQGLSTRDAFTQHSSGRTQVVATEEILRYWQLFLKALSFQHLEKYFAEVIFLSWAQPKLVHFSFLCSAVSKFISLLCTE